ncbi:MAG TPA: 3-isopropylmalate dehydrogenase [Clostridiaceae bacterium]|nr:3-isopropylmalate dehydrogenase [Clostridiaceae bacterium]
MKNNKILVLKGDGVGPEIIDSALEVLNKISQKSGKIFHLIFGDIGGVAIDKHGHPFPEETEQKLQDVSAVLLGAVGGPKWDNIDPAIRPEKGLLALRKALGVYANLRPCRIYPGLIDNSPLKPEYLKNVDFVIIRELVGGIYFGKRDTFIANGLRTAFDEERYDEMEIKRIAVYAFETAMGRSKKLTLVDKANVLDSSKLWREVVGEIAEDYPEVKLEYLYVDNAAMQLIRQPSSFDVILTNNIFGDILSDEASQIAGSIGLLPSASLGANIGLYEPVHGSAPDIAGQNIVNPLATILSLAMLLRYSFGLQNEAEQIEQAVDKVLADGYRTKDLASDDFLGTFEITDEVIKNL